LDHWITWTLNDPCGPKDPSDPNYPTDPRGPIVILWS